MKKSVEPEVVGYAETACFLTVNIDDEAPRLYSEGDWPNPWRVEKGVREFLDRLEENGALVTFFVRRQLHSQAARLIREIHSRGHEVACRGGVDVCSFHPLRDDLRAAKAYLEDAGGAAIRGYRSSDCSVNNEQVWILELLAEEGFEYDSSISLTGPCSRGRLSGWPKRPVRVRTAGGVILEAPARALSPRVGWWGSLNNVLRRRQDEVVCVQLREGICNDRLPFQFPVRPLRNLLVSGDPACDIDLYPFGISNRPLPPELLEMQEQFRKSWYYKLFLSEDCY